MQSGTGDGASLSIRDNRTGKEYSIPIRDGAIRATDLRQIKVAADDFGLMSYDPAFMNTASCRSAITFIDGDIGILRYRGYPIEDLAGELPYLDVASLILNGEVPTEEHSKAFAAAVTRDSVVPEWIVDLIRTFPRSSHPMAMLMAAISALGTTHPEAKKVLDPEIRAQQVTRLIGAVSTLAGLIFRQVQGRSLDLPAPTGNYARDFLVNLFADSPSYVPHPGLVQAMDVLFILHADHEQNCSANAVRAVGSSQVDPYSAMAAGIAALFGPLHGGANEQVLRMLREIGSIDRVPAFIESVKTGHGRLMGFGHRVYKSYDPRAKLIKKMTDQVLAITGENPLLRIALELEKIALADQYFVSRKLYPNVDFYSGLIYEALGLPPEMFTVMFAVPRMSGWVAQWLELVQDDEQKIARPRQIFTGHDVRAFKPVARV